MSSLSTHTRRRSAGLRLEGLEDRANPYVLSGLSWSTPSLSYSFIADGTPAEGATSTLFATLNLTAPTATWQREVARALQTWADATNLNFHLAPAGSTGNIHLGAVPQGGSLGYSYYPSDGGVYLNPAYQYPVGADYDLYSVVLHEFGHSLGLMHSDVAGAVMAPTYAGIRPGLTADDTAGIQAIYGARRPDAYDAAAANDTLSAATPLALSGGSASLTADLTTMADVDYYRVTAAGTSVTVTVDARNRSLLAPKVLVYDAAGTLLGSAAADYGQAATVTVGGLTPGQAYYLVADGATADAFGMGAYALSAQFASSPAPAAPTNLAASAASASQVNLSWRDNSTNETGFRVEESTDGTNFSFVANAPADATTYSVTGLAPGTQYYFRVRAFNGTDSAWSNTAQAATPGLAPTANADSYSTVHDQNLSVAAAGGVLANDASNPAGRPLTAAVVSGPAHGTLTLNANGSFTYRPAAGFAGTDSFTYAASDGAAASPPATVTVSVTDQAPAGAADAYTAALNQALTVGATGGVLANDADPDGDPLTAVLAAGPAHGTLTLNPNGSFTYTPAAGFAGADGFTYVPTDGIQAGPAQAVAITVRDATPVPQVDGYNLSHDRKLTVGKTAGVLANDTSPGGLPMTAILADKPAHGTVTLNANGSFAYTPARGFVGIDSFTYRAKNSGGTSAPTTVTLTVNDRAPLAAADTFQVTEGRRLARAGRGVLANDTDADGDRRTAALVAGPAHGTLTLSPIGAFVYRPAPGFVGTDSFQYQDVTRLQDSAPTTVTISVLAAPEVTSVVINDGSAQRSLVRSITITFDTLVTFGPGAFSLFRVGGGIPALTRTVTQANGQTTVVLTFAGSGTQFGSLGDGDWVLRVNASRVHRADFRPAIMSASQVDRFHRLFGDANGDGSVDDGDKAAFTAALGQTDAASLATFDFDHNGAVDATDQSRFDRRFGRRI